MKIVLTPEEQVNLETRHRRERDGRIKDRIKAVLLSAEGWSQVMISQALRIRVETVHDHLTDYQKNQKLKPENGGSQSQLSALQSQELSNHLESKTRLKVFDICAYVKETYGVTFTVSGMTKWLKRYGFVYKKPKATPGKANRDQQAAFVRYYNDLLTHTPLDEPIEFGDGVHPTMSTKVTAGWIKRGKKNDKIISTTASRTRINLMGSLNLETMSLTLEAYDRLNSQSMKQHFEALRVKYPKAPKIHLILDRGPYNRSKDTCAAAKKYGIVLHFLPPYSPNLNPIERLWKLMNEHVRNNVVFSSTKEFRIKVMGFFNDTWPQIAHTMIERINDNFQTLKQAS